MKIAVDVRILSEPVTGIGRYTHEVLKRLIEYDHEWFLYSHRPITVGRWNHPNVKIRSFNFSGRTMRMFWAQSYLPYLAANDKVDLFWSPAHRIPQLLPSSISSVVTIHDLVWCHAGETMRTSSKWLDSLLMPRAIKVSKAVISVSAATTRDLIEKFPVEAHKFITIPLGVNKAKFENYSDCIQEYPYILFVGTLEPRKNLRRLIAAFALTTNLIPYDIKLVIVGGSGWGEVHPNDIAIELGIRDRVIVLGYVSEARLDNLYKYAMFLAMPSIYEGFGLPVLEAMSYGLPILTSNISSMPEIAGDAALLVDPNDINSIAGGLIKLVIDQELRYSLSIAGIKIAKKYTWESSARKTLEVFKMYCK
jgi:glycosyltransferase involved in cell wall biosynthesis